MKSSAFWTRGALLVACSSAILGCTAGYLPVNFDGGDGGDGSVTNDAAVEAAPACAAVSGVDHTTCYPEGDVGTTARSGNVPGQRIQNFSFVGYPTAMGQPVVTSAGTKQVQLADFFDPAAQDFAIVVLAVVTAWNAASNQLSDELVARAPTYAPKKAVFVQVLQQGADINGSANVQDLDLWVSAHALNQTAVIDPTMLLKFPGVPTIVVLDARSMEILYSAMGAPPSMPVFLDKYLALVKTIPVKP